MEIYNKQYLFEKMNVPKAVLYLAVPTIISQLITIVYNWADTLFVGQLGDTNMIASITICHPVFMITTAIANLLGIGGASAISRALGEKKFERIKKISSFSLYTTLLVSILFSFFIFIFQDPLLAFLGDTPNTSIFTKQYMFWVIILGALPTIMNSTLAHLVRSTGKSRQASIGISLGAIINILLDPLFIFVFGLQVEGAAIATFISNILATMYFIFLLLKERKHSILDFSIKNLRIKDKVALDVLGSGLSSFLLSLMAVCSNASINKLMSNVEEAAISAVSIAKKVDLCVIAFTMGLAQGILPLVGYNYAAKNHFRMQKIIHFSVFITLGFSLICLILFFIFPKPIVSIFIRDDATIHYATSFLRIMCSSMPLTAIIFIANSVFQATKQNGKALTLILLRKGLIDIPLMILLNRFIPIYGVVLSQPIVDSFAGIIAIILYLIFLKQEKKKINVPA